MSKEAAFTVVLPGGTLYVRIWDYGWYFIENKLLVAPSWGRGGCSNLSNNFKHLLVVLLLNLKFPILESQIFSLMYNQYIFDE